MQFYPLFWLNLDFTLPPPYFKTYHPLFWLNLDFVLFILKFEILPPRFMFFKILPLTPFEFILVNVVVLNWLNYII